MGTLQGLRVLVILVVAPFSRAKVLKSATLATTLILVSAAEGISDANPFLD
jgi:hypothetical protein